MPQKPGLGVTSRVETPDHQWKYASIYFRTEQARDDYRWAEITRKAAKHAGWPHATRNDLLKFHEHREQYRAAREAIKEREKQDRKTRDKLRKARGLSKNSNMMNIVLDPVHPEIRAVGLGYVRKSAAQKAEEKIEAIRKLYEDGTPEREIIILVSQIVGYKGKP